jgi:DNA-binding MarR family transcriptional regulator
MGNVVVAAERLPKLEDYLCFAVYSANLPLHRLLKPLLDEVGLTYPQYLVLIALYDDDHQTVGGLGDKLFLDSSTLTPLLKRMEAMGYVVRQRDPQDERQVRIRLTPRGRSVREKGIGFRADLNLPIRHVTTPRNSHVTHNVRSPARRPPPEAYSRHPKNALDYHKAFLPPLGLQQVLDGARQWPRQGSNKGA